MDIAYEADESTAGLSQFPVRLQRVCFPPFFSGFKKESRAGQSKMHRKSDLAQQETKLRVSSTKCACGADRVLSEQDTRFPVDTCVSNALGIQTRFSGECGRQRPVHLSPTDLLFSADH